VSDADSRSAGARSAGASASRTQDAGSAASRTAALFAVTGELGNLDAAARQRLFDRGRATDPAVEAVVRQVITEVRSGGDDALRQLALRFDGVQLEALEVPAAVCEAALQALDAGVREALEQAAHNIAVFHRAQLPEALEIEPMPGMRLGRRADALRRVGVYAPGGRAAYPSSVLMGVVPAKVAGVREVVVCSPPDSSGLPPQTVLAACSLAGADRVFALGGAGAVAALALGTESVPRVDKIVGPGNAYVTEAKRQLTGQVAIDSPAGPSEILVLADSTADATLIAVELLAQAEHDPDAASVLVTTEPALLAAVATRTAELLEQQPRAAIIRASLAARGALLSADSVEQATAFAEEYAPEHLLVLTHDPRALLPALRSAGTIFLGPGSSVAFGDYMTGANHVLPTAGLARAYSGLSTLDFVRWTTYQELDSNAAAQLAPATSRLAEAEGLPAHALAARLRMRQATDGGVPDQARRASDTIAPRASYRELTLYDPGRLPCETDLSDNTNLFGVPPSLRSEPLPAASPAPGATSNAAGAARITRYPSVYATELKRAVAEMLGVAPQHVTTGCGSDDVIDSAVRAFCEPAATLAYPEPTFGMVPSFARMNAVRPVPVPLLDGFVLDADALLATRARLTYLCRPNNPTGTAFERAAVERVCNEAAGVVLVDEAYADFADDDLVHFATGSDRTVVLRTMSKAYGMAGLRIGFAVGPADLIAEIEKSRGPYKVGGVAEAAALAVLTGDRGWVSDCIAEVRQNRDRLRAELSRRGVVTFPSAANFVLLQAPGLEPEQDIRPRPSAAAPRRSQPDEPGLAAEWNGRLRARGVAVRPFAALHGAGECVRVTVGPWPVMERFLTAFDDILNIRHAES
jgi:histidinol dehydrogenase